MATPGCGFFGERSKSLVRERHGANYLRDRHAQTELARINRELERLRFQIAALEERKSKLRAGAAGNRGISGNR